MWVPTLGWAWSVQEPQRLTPGHDGGGYPVERMIFGVIWDPTLRHWHSAGPCQAPYQNKDQTHQMSSGLLISRHLAQHSTRLTAVNPPGSWATEESRTSLLIVLCPVDTAVSQGSFPCLIWKVRPPLENRRAHALLSAGQLEVGGSTGARLHMHPYGQSLR